MVFTSAFARAEKPKRAPDDGREDKTLLDSDGLRIYTTVFPRYQGGAKLAVSFQIGDKKVQIFGRRGISNADNARSAAQRVFLATCSKQDGRLIFRVILDGTSSRFYVVDLAGKHFGEFPATTTQCPAPASAPPMWDPPLRPAP